MFVKYTEEKQTKKGVNRTVKYRLLGVTARFAALLDSDEARVEYCRNCGLNEPVVLIPKIKIGTFFRFGKTLLRLSGFDSVSSNTWQLAQQNVQPAEVELYLKKIHNALEDKEKAKKMNLPFVLNERDGISAELNRAMYDTFVSTLCSEKYSGAQSLGTVGKNLIKSREQFLNLPLIEQCSVLAEIATVLQCNGTTAKLNLLGLGETGRIRMSSTLEWDELRDIKIVYRSITGVFEQQIPLADFDKEASNK